MDYGDILAPVGLFLVVVAAAAALYFVVTWIRGRFAARRDDHRGSHMR